MMRAIEIAALGWASLILAGCNEAASKPMWDNVKIGDLAPAKPGPGEQQIKTANIDVHIYEVPAGNVGKLEDLWESVYTRAVRFYSYQAFAGNLFRAGFGKRFGWSGTEDLLRAAGGKRMAKIALLLPDGQPQDVTVTGLGRPEELSYIDADLSREKAVIGPGVMSLRVTAQKVAGERGVCEVIGCPVFSVPMTSPIEPLAGRARQQEVKFTGAGFGLKMSPDDFVVLGPQKYLSERVTLPGLFFSNLDGTVFLSKGRPPERKISVRVFVLVCTGINY